MAAAFDLDHVGIAVRDLDAAAATYRRLGFTLTEKSHHVAPDDAGLLRRTGTGNHCFIFEEGYCELIAATASDYSGSLLAALDRHEGLHLIALGTKPAAEAASTLTRTSGKPVEPRRVQRPFIEQGRPLTAEFAILDLPDGAAPEAQLFGIEHLTPEAIWQPHLLVHPNCAKALASVLVCVPDPAEFAGRVAHLFAAKSDGDLVQLARGTIEVVDPAGLTSRFPGTKPPTVPSVCAMTIVSSDLRRTQQCLTSDGIPFATEDGRLWVPGEAACGAVIEFHDEQKGGAHARNASPGPRHRRPAEARIHSYAERRTGRGGDRHPLLRAELSRHLCHARHARPARRYAADPRRRHRRDRRNGA